MNSNNSLLSIAIDYCYESQEAFSRAFYQLYNMTPGEFRKKGLFYPIRKKVDIDYIAFEIDRRVNGMTPEIKFRDEINIAGKSVTIHGIENYYKEIPIFWQKWCNELYSKKIVGDLNKTQIAGVCIPVNKNNMSYLIGHLVDADFQVPEGYELFKIEPGRYAVFTATEPLTESVQKTWDYIWGTWLISSEYIHSGKPEFELYYCRDGKNYADIYVPI